MAYWTAFPTAPLSTSGRWAGAGVFFFPVETRCGGYRHLGHAETAMAVANGGYPKLTIGFGWKMMFETILLYYFKG